MKDQFKEFYTYSESEEKNIREDCIFVFDTNIILWLYRIPEDSRKELIKILKKLQKKNQIWSPHQIIYEFHKNRRNIIIWLENDYNEAIHAIEWVIAELPKKVEGKLKEACNKHPLLNFEEIYQKAQTWLKSITEEITKIKSEKHPNRKNKDQILTQIEKIFSNFWEEYTEKELI